MKTAWVRLSLIYFFIIALLGILMRLGFFNGYFPLEYKHLLHTHSHIAFLGWIYPVLFIAIVNNFLSKEEIIKGKYHLQFIITQALVAGMLVSFLLQGYGLFSIIFSSVFQLMTYWFAFSLFKGWRRDSRLSVRFIKTGLAALVLSSLGTWGLAVIGAKGLVGSDLYNMAIYFYLHFQYNGWFSFAILGLLVGLLEKNFIRYSKKIALFSYYLLAFSLYPAYLLSLPGITDNMTVIGIGAVTGIVQLAGTVLFVPLMLKSGRLFYGYIKPLMAISLFSFILKNVLQLLSVLPSLTDLAFNNRYVVIAYIHLVFIGFISFFLFGYLSCLGWYNLKTFMAKAGVIFLIAGFTVTEFLLIAPAFQVEVPKLMLLILGFSVTMALGLAMFIAAQLRKVTLDIDSSDKSENYFRKYEFAGDYSHN